MTSSKTKLDDLMSKITESPIQGVSEMYNLSNDSENLWGPGLQFIISSFVLKQTLPILFPI